jgi:hypothetical protein
MPCPTRHAPSPDPLELAPLLILAQLDAADAAAESALRAQRKLIEGQIASCIVDAALEHIHRLELGTLGRDETEDRDFAFREETQRRQIARALAVVFEQKPVVLEPGEQALGDAVVASFPVPLRHHLAGYGIDAARIAAADMQPEGHALEAGDDIVLGLDAALQALVRVLATRPHAVERDLIDIRGEARRIDMNVTAAGCDQLGYHPPLDRHDVGQEFVDILVDRLRPLPGEPLRNPIWADEAHLDRARGCRRRKPIPFQHDVTLQAQALHDRTAGGDRRAGRIEVLLGAVQGLVRLAPIGQSLDLLRHIVSDHRVTEAFLKIAPPELPVGHDRQPDRLLLSDDLADGVVLGGDQLRVRRLAARVAFERVAQALRRNEAAVLIDAEVHKVGHGLQQWSSAVGCRRSSLVSSSSLAAAGWESHFQNRGARCRTTRIRSRRGRASEYAVNLGGHDEVVLMQSLDLLGLQRDRRIAPTEADIRMMAFSFREFTNLLNKGKRLPEIAKPEAPLNAVSFRRQLPVRSLCMKDRSLLEREWRYSPATGSTGFARKCFGHVACSSCQPSPAPRLANCESDVAICASQPLKGL